MSRFPTAPGHRRLAMVGAAASGLLVATSVPAFAVPDDQRIFQSPPIPGQLEQFDFYGWGLAVGDFDGDGFDDLATSANDESIGGVAGAGAVIVVYGSKRGLVKSRNQFFHQNTRGVPDKSETADKFSESMATGDFDGDGFDDLAVGVPSEARRGVDNAGIVQVFYGSRRGLRMAGNQLLEQGHRGIKGAQQTDDMFGFALAAGDVDGNGRDDLVVNAVGDTVKGVGNAGSVTIVFGGRAGLTRRNQVVTQATPRVPDRPEDGDQFGSQLAVGDLDADGLDDIAAGSPAEDAGATQDVGTVHVLWGGRNGVVRGRQFQQDDWLGGTNEEGDRFGQALAIGRLLPGRGGTLLVGAPNEDDCTGWVGQAKVGRAGLSRRSFTVGPQPKWCYGREVAIGRAGGARVSLRSAPNATGMFGGVDVTGGVVFGQGLLNQDTGPWDPEPNDGFGTALASGDFDGDRFPDCAVGIPFKDIGALMEAGGISVFYKVATPSPARPR